jgi:hypothetical protein
MSGIYYLSLFTDVASNSAVGQMKETERKTGTEMEGSYRGDIT